MMHQSTSSILMVRPANFGFNMETASNNFYQKMDDRLPEEINTMACTEFDAFVDLLVNKGIEVITLTDSDEPKKLDAIFPNNWFSTHENGILVLYPMFSPNRRLERRKDLVEILLSRGFQINEIIDLTFFERDDQFLEGSGSLVMERVNKVVYACHSERTHPIPLAYFANLMGYSLIEFNANINIDGKNLPVYHTNVMMHVGSDFAVVCLDSVTSVFDQLKIKKSLQETGKKIIPITIKQKFNFAGNMLEVMNKLGNKYTVMSESALRSLKKGQVQQIENFTEIIAARIPTIEKIGGGSTRCMMAEIFLPLSK